MSKQTFEVTKEGVKLPYSRFLSDSAGGYIIIFLIFFAIYTNYANLYPLTETTIYTFAKDSPAAAAAVVVLAGLLILLLGSPVGLVLNAISWFSVGWIQMVFINFWSRHKWFWVGRLLAYSTSREFNLELLETSFDFISPPKNKYQYGLFSQVGYIEWVLRVHYTDVVEQISYLTGVVKFVRNLAIITLVYWFLFGYSKYIPIIFVSLLILMCFIELYNSLAILSVAHIICTEKWKLTPSQPAAPAMPALATPAAALATPAAAPAAAPAMPAAPTNKRNFTEVVDTLIEMSKKTSTPSTPAQT